MMALSASCKRRSPTTQPSLPDHDRPLAPGGAECGFHAMGLSLDPSPRALERPRT